MTAESWTVIGAAIVMLAILVPVQVRIMQDVAGLRERMARLERLFEGEGLTGASRGATLRRPEVPHDRGRMKVSRLFGAMLAGAVLAVSACDSSPEGMSPPGVPSGAQIPTFIEHLNADGEVVDVTEPGRWDGHNYPIRIVRQDAKKRVVSEQILSEAPTVTSIIDQMTPAQLDEMERLLKDAKDAAALSPQGEGFELEAALDELNTIRGRQK
jgi:hypothetical protein